MNIEVQKTFMFYRPTYDLCCAVTGVAQGMLALQMPLIRMRAPLQL